MSDVARAARVGFGAAAEAYARGRPDYPPELIGWLREELCLGTGATAIDVGAGTGKFTSLLTRTGAAVVAVEPLEAMRAQLLAQLPDARVVAGTAQATGLPTGAADAVACAQSFHWFAEPRAVAEIHRVLRPAGRLGLVWNVRDETCGWVAAITDIVRPYEGDAPRFGTGEWRDALAGTRFSAPRETCFEYLHVGEPRHVIIDRTLSVSYVAALPAAQKADVLRRLSELVAHHPDVRGRATVAFPYRTHAYRLDRQ